MALCYQILIFALCCQAVYPNVDELSPQEKLLQRFFGEGRRMAEVLPKRNFSDGKPLIAKLGYVISHIYEVKSNEEEIDLCIWISLQWKNELVSWNTSEYPIEYMQVPINKVWMPRLYLLENAVPKPMIPSNDNSNVLIFSNGLSIVDYAMTIKLTCSMKACLFPADEHTCPFTLNSIAYDDSLLQIEYNEKTLEDYGQFEKKETGLWTLKRGPVVQSSFPAVSGSKQIKNSCLKSSIKLTRKPGYYGITVIGPIILICIATFCSVLLPWESGERTSLLITCFLALIVYLDTILENVPKTSDYTPFIVWFVVVVLLFTILQIMFTSLASYYAERANKGKKFVAPYKSIMAYFTKIFLKKKKKDEAKIQSLNLVDYRNNGVDNDVEIVRQYPLKRQNSHGHRKKFSSESYAVNRNMSTEMEDKMNGIPEDSGTGETGNHGSGVDTGPSKGKRCKKACRFIDRVSIFVSASFIIFCPIFFQLLFTRKLPANCT